MRALSSSFFARPAEVVAPELIGCRLVKRQDDCSLLWGGVKPMSIPKRSPLAMASAAAYRKKKRCLEMLRTLLLSSGQQQLPFAFDVRLTIKSLRSGIKSRGDFDELMKSATVIWSEVFGS